MKTIAKLLVSVVSYGFLGLTLLVAIPLPFTGVYTASILSWLLNMNWRRAFSAIMLGVIVAGIIVLLITLGFVELCKGGLLGKLQ